MQEKEVLLRRKRIKKREDGSNWDEMIDGDKSSSKETKNESNDKEDEKDYDIKSYSNGLNFKTAMRKYSNKIAKDVLNELIMLKKKGKLSEEEFIDKLVRESRSEQRRLTRINKRENTICCFQCRKPGHSVNDCPEVSKDYEQGVGVCYKCGSTEHSVNKCKVKVEPGHYPFAKCFICKEVGHLSKQCPDNPRGLYPNGNK